MIAMAQHVPHFSLRRGFMLEEAPRPHHYRVQPQNNELVHLPSIRQVRLGWVPGMLPRGG